MTPTQMFIVAVIGAGATALATIVTAVAALISARANAKLIVSQIKTVAAEQAKKSDEQAKKVEEVKVALEDSKDTTEGKLNDLAGAVSGAVGDIKKIELATNSMKDALVKATREAAFAEGGKEERDRADAKQQKIDNKVQSDS